MPSSSSSKASSKSKTSKVTKSKSKSKSKAKSKTKAKAQTKAQKKTSSKAEPVAKEKTKTRPKSTRVIEKGDMVRITYVGRDLETNKVVDTNDEIAARKGRIYRKDKHYGPSLVVVGDGWVIPGLDRELVGMKEGETKEVELTAKECYGLRDTALIKLVHRKEFQRLEIKPKPGMRVFILGKEGTVTSVSQNRIRMDFNHELAGKDLRYTISVDEVIEDIDDKILALLQNRMKDTDIEGTRIVHDEDDTVTVMLPRKVIFYQHIQFVKVGVAEDTYRYLPEVKLVRFLEEFPPVVLGNAPEMPSLIPEGVIELGEPVKRTKAEADPDYQYE